MDAYKDSYKELTTAIALLEARLDAGMTIAKQDNKWRLFAKTGECACSGRSLFELIRNQFYYAEKA